MSIQNSNLTLPSPALLLRRPSQTPARSGWIVLEPNIRSLSHKFLHPLLSHVSSSTYKITKETSLGVQEKTQKKETPKLSCCSEQDVHLLVGELKGSSQLPDLLGAEVLLVLEALV